MPPLSLHLVEQHTGGYGYVIGNDVGVFGVTAVAAYYHIDAELIAGAETIPSLDTMHFSAIIESGVIATALRWRSIETVAHATEKEIAVIRLVCAGKSRSEIVRELGLSESTIKPIITSILDKSGFDSISKFAIYAVSRGLIVVSE